MNRNKYIKSILTEDFLRQKFEKEQLSVPQVAIETNISIDAILRYMKKFKITTQQSKNKNLSDRKINELIVLNKCNRPEGIKTGQYYEVKCKCLTIFTCRGSSLVNGNTQSCGCILKESAKTTHFTGYEEITGDSFSICKYGAKKRNIPFEITIENMWNQFIKQDRKCALSDVELTMTKSRKEKGTASLDRRDNTKGYTIDNIQWIHKDLNFMKQDFSELEFINWCNLIVKHRGETK